MTVAISALFAGLALAGCTGGDTGDDGPSGDTTAPQAVVTASPLSPKVGETVTFTAQQGGDSDTFAWEFGDGTSGTGKTVTHAYASPGQYIVLLTVKRGDKTVTNDASLTYLTVSPQALELANITDSTAPLASAAVSTQVAEINEEVAFDSNASGSWEANPDFDPTAPIDPTANSPFTATGDVSVVWDFDDNGATADTRQATHAFAQAGLYAVKLTATSATGQSSDYVISVRVLPELPPTQGVRNPGTFITATIGEPETLDPAVDYETAGGTVLQQVYDTLVFYQRDAADKFEGRLATSVPTATGDGLVYTFTLKSGATFHDGNPVTAEDVKFSLDRLILINDPNGPAWIYSTIKGADAYFQTGGTQADREAYLAENGIEVVDASTVRITLGQIDPAFIAKLAFNAASIMSMKTVCAHAQPDYVDCLPPAGERDPWMATHEAGSGAFRLDAWIPNQQIIMKRFDAYHGAKPKVETVIIQKVEDINTRLLMLFSGQADEVYVGVDNEDSVKDKAGLRITEQASWTVSFIGLNQKFCRGPAHKDFATCMTSYGDDAPKGADGTPDPLFFSDENMRKAWIYAFDYDTYFNDILNKHGKMLNGPLPEGILGYDASIEAPKQDVELAKQALEASNHPDGFSATIFFNSGNTVREKTAQLLAQNLEALAPGKIQVSAQGLDFSTAFIPRNNARALPVFYLGWAPDYAYPDNYAVTFAHSSKGIYAARVGYSNPELDAKLDELTSETDEAALKAGYSEAVKMLNEDNVFLWLAQGANYHVEREWVRGYYFNPMFSGNPNMGDYTAVSKG